MTAGRHRRDGQYRDDLSAWLRSLRATARDTWTVIRLSWLVLTILISRRVPRAAGGAPGRFPVAGAPEAPATACPPGRAGASPRLPDAAPGEVTAPASPGAATRPPWVITQPPPGTPQVTWSGKPTHTVISDWRGTWAINHSTGAVTRAGDWRGGAGRDTIAMPVADSPARASYVAAHEAWLDAPAAVIA